MGADASKTNKRSPSGSEVGEEELCPSGWKGLLSSVSLSIPASLCRLAPPTLRRGQRRMIEEKAPPFPDQVLLGGGPDRLRAEWTLPGFISVFLPEFPHRALPAPQRFQVLGYIAKGSFGPILKVKDNTRQKTYAVKVIPKSEILRLGVLEQSKEEVIVQRQVRHPFVHDLEDCWQTQRHLYIMCDFCSTGDLYTYWVMIGQFNEDAVRVFAAELGCALGFLHDFGIIHRDVKMENVLLTDQGHLRLADFGLSRRLERGGRAFTICGTIQYMAPEVLSGGPYSHAADWWSLGILLFSLVTGKFPVSPEPDHCSMLRKVRCFPYDIPHSISPPLALLITELLCKTPTRRLRTLERYKRQTFFRGMTFDLALLQRRPVEVILALRERPDRAAKARRGLTLSLQPLKEFDYDALLSPAATPDTLLEQETHTLLEQETHTDLEQETHTDLEQERHTNLEQDRHTNLEQETHTNLEQGTHTELEQETHTNLEQETHTQLEKETHFHTHQADQNGHSNTHLDAESHTHLHTLITDLDGQNHHGDTHSAVSGPTLTHSPGGSEPQTQGKKKEIFV